MTRRLVLVVASLLAAAATVLAGSSLSFAEAPWRVGWWTVANPGLPPLVAGVEFPPNNVPDGGFEVAGNAQSPTSVAALLYDIPERAAVGPLVITIAEGIPAAPTTTVQACPLVDRDFKTDDGAPMSDAPEWDCSDPSLGTIDPSGESFSFDVARFVDDDLLAVAIVPAVSAQAVFAPPTDNSLEVRKFEGDQTRSASPPTTRAAARSGPPPNSDPLLPLDALDGGVEEFSASGAGELTPTPRSAGTEAVAAVGSEGDLGAGSAAFGGVVVGLLGCVVWMRARRALDTAVGSREPRPRDVHDAP